MTPSNRVEADHEAIADFRKEFDRFAYEQKQYLERAEWLIAMAIEDLEGAQYKWRRNRVDYERQLEECEEEADYAATWGRYVNCADWENAIEECDRALDVLDRAHDRLSIAVGRYEAERSAVERWLGFELPKVRKYLDDRINALRAFLTETV